MMTKWAVQTKNTVNTSMLGRIKVLMAAKINTGVVKDFDWPRMQDALDSEERTKLGTPKRCTRTNETNRMPTGQIWISDDDYKLLLRILIAPHTVWGGLRAAGPTFSTVGAHFRWRNLRDHTAEFTRSCFHCIATKHGNIIPRSLSHTLHASRPNELFNLDYRYLNKGEYGKLYTLIVKDDLSGYVWLRSAETADSETTADVLVEWFSTFGVAWAWISDHGRHFKSLLAQ